MNNSMKYEYKKEMKIAKKGKEDIRESYRLVTLIATSNNVFGIKIIENGTIGKINEYRKPSNEKEKESTTLVKC